MINLRYLITVVLLAGWVVGFFGFNPGKDIHLLLVMSMITISVNIIREGGLLSNV